MVSPLKFGNGYCQVISSQTLLDMWLSIHDVIEVDPWQQKEDSDIATAVTSHCTHANKWVSTMRAPIMFFCEPAGSYKKLLDVLYVFEHKTQYRLIHAPYTNIVAFWHISNMLHISRRVKYVIIPHVLYNSNICKILLYNRQLIVITYEPICAV